MRNQWIGVRHLVSAWVPVSSPAWGDSRKTNPHRQYGAGVIPSPTEWSTQWRHRLGEMFKCLYGDNSAFMTVAWSVPPRHWLCWKKSSMRSPDVSGQEQSTLQTKTVNCVLNLIQRNLILPFSRTEQSGYAHESSWYTLTFTTLKTGLIAYWPIC